MSAFGGKADIGDPTAPGKKPSIEIYSSVAGCWSTIVEINRRQRMRQHHLGIVTATMIGTLSAFAAQAETLNLRYAQAYSAAHSIFALPVSVAQSQGLFAREGLNVQMVIPIPGGSDKMIAALHDDWADVTHVATPFLIRAALAGSDAVAIDAEFKSPIYSLIAKPEIKSFADLKGKLIGLADETGTISLSILKLLKAHGLKADNYSVKIIEGTPARLHCLRRGECDAVVLGQPQDLQAIEESYQLLGRSDDAVPEYLYTVTAVRRSWADAHREAMLRFVRAMATACDFVRDIKNRDRVVRVISETTGASNSIAGKTLDLVLQPGRHVLPDRAAIDLDGLQQVIAMMGEASLIEKPLPQPERFVDLQYLHTAGVQ
jgi:ABC-type nitrate/sulfonate/bicarbonate transport system substrate-binding protein